MWNDESTPDVFFRENLKGKMAALKGETAQEVGPLNLDSYATFEQETYQRSVDFIERSVTEGRPFFLYWAANTVSYFTSHPDWLGKSAQGTHNGDQMIEHDHYVGQIRRKLEDLGIAENTLVVWMSDNGPMYDLFPEASYTAFTGGKGDVLEGGVHVPAMAWWPGVIEPGRTSTEIVQVTDFYTTAARIGGVMDKVPSDRVIDGIEQSAHLMSGEESRRKYMFHYAGEHLGAVRVGQYKRHLGTGHGGLPGAGFFDLYKDPKEENGVMVSMLWAWVPFEEFVDLHEATIKKFPHREPYRSK